MLYAWEVAEALVQGLVVDANDVAGKSGCQAVVDVVLAAQTHVCLWHLEGGWEVELVLAVLDEAHASFFVEF